MDAMRSVDKLPDRHRLQVPLVQRAQNRCGHLSSVKCCDRRWSLRVSDHGVMQKKDPAGTEISSRSCGNYRDVMWQPVLSLMTPHHHIETERASGPKVCEGLRTERWAEPANWLATDPLDNVSRIVKVACERCGIHLCDAVVVHSVQCELVARSRDLGSKFRFPGCTLRKYEKRCRNSCVV